MTIHMLAGEEEQSMMVERGSSAAKDISAMDIILCHELMLLNADDN